MARWGAHPTTGNVSVYKSIAIDFERRQERCHLFMIYDHGRKYMLY